MKPPAYHRCCLRSKGDLPLNQTIYVQAVLNGVVQAWGPRGVPLYVSPTIPPNDVLWLPYSS